MPAGAVGDKLRLAFGSGFRGRRCVLRSRRPVLRSIESGRARVGTRAGGVINTADVLMGEQVTPAGLGVAERRCGAEKFDQCGQELRAGCLVEIVACGGNLDGHGVGHCVGEGLLMPRRDRLIVRAHARSTGMSLSRFVCRDALAVCPRQSRTVCAVRTNAVRRRNPLSPRSASARGRASERAARTGNARTIGRVSATGSLLSPPTTVPAPGKVAARSIGVTSAPRPPLLINTRRSVRSGNW